MTRKTSGPMLVLGLVDAKDLISLIQTLGFPVFVAMWYMLRTEKKLDRMTAAMARLTTANMILARTMDLPEHDRARADRLLSEEEERGTR